MTLRWTAAVLLALALAACDEAPLAPSTATDTAWKLESIERDGQSAVPVPDPGRYTLQLDPTGRLSVRADCNTCGGSYTLSGPSLTVGNALACTRAFCGTASLDTAFLAALSGTQTVTVSATNLALRGNGTTLRFRR
jgi:heat shock protein HslJ